MVSAATVVKEFTYIGFCSTMNIALQTQNSG